MNQELERFEPAEVTGRIAYEHLHRYAICRDRVTGLRVLDVACGAGYGTNILAQAAAEATGVDIDGAAISRAARKYKRENLKFVTADCHDLPFNAGSFDVVVANEMIEHIDEQDAFLEEVTRVLKPGGTLLVSTPNKPVYNRYKTPNPFHVSEMTIPEFRRLLKRHFGHAQFTGLRMALVSAGFEIDGPQQGANLAAAKTYRGLRLQSARPAIGNDELQFEEPEYILATCSDRPIQDAPAHSTIFFSNEDDLWLEHEKIMAWASQLHEEDEVLRANLRDARVELDEVRGAFDEEKRTNGQSSDQARQHLTVSSRLLSRLTGSGVAPDPTSLVEAMFALNEQIVMQRAHLERLSETEKRVRDLQQELEAGRTEHERRVAEMRREFEEAGERLAQENKAAREQLSTELKVAHDTHQAQRTELDLARIERARLADELRGTQLRMNELQRHAEQLSTELNAARDAHQAQLAELDLARIEQARLADELRGTQLRMNELQRHTRERHEQRDSDLREAEQRALALESQLKEAQVKIARFSNDRERPAQEPREEATAPEESGGVHAADKTGAGRQSRRRSRLTSSHRQIQDELGRASAAMRGALPPASPAPRSFTGRLFGFRSMGRGIPFDRAWIECQVPDVGRISIGAFLKNPRFYHVDPHPLFASAYYLDRHPDIAAAEISPLAHYLEHGWREGRDPHPYFANDWYLQQNPDVLRAGINPLVHYLEYGWKEGRRPNPVFDPKAYLAQNPDVEASGVEPLSHFIAYGLQEDRAIPFLGLERDWRAMVANSHAQSLMDYLLSEEVSPGVALPPVDTDDESWPPRPLNDFWIPQALRDLMVERGWSDVIPLYTYFYSVMDAYAEAPDEFRDSNACRRIVKRIRELSTQASRPQSATEVSVIVPVYNNVLDTLLCVASLLETAPANPFEILVADDSSNDATERLIPELGGIVRHVRHARNLGFVGNCNGAAEQARGDRIALLNNDALVLPGWLENLVGPFDRFDRVGLVGSKLINWDGRLQEAGGIFWKDGSAWNFGRGQNASDPEYNYLKDVDYCSGASIAIPTDLWRRLGGFDPDYAPAYCEDSDLAFRIREAGYRTLYSPRSELIHHEGRSHGRDTATGIKAYQVTNQKRLFDRWRRVLERDHFRNGENVLRARDRSIRKPHILVIDHYVPQFDKDAGSRTMFQFLEALVGEGWAVTFWPENLYHDPYYTESIQEIGVEVIYGPKFVGKFSDFLRSRTGLYDAVLLSRPHVAVHFIDDVRTLTDARVLYYGHDVHFERMKAQKEVAGSTIEEDAVEAMRALELTLCDRCDVILYPSEDEADLMAKLVAPSVQSRSIPAYRYSDAEISEASEEAKRISPLAGKPAQLLFVGGFAHGPNADGIAWFSREVAPILRSQGFQFEVQIAGSNPTAEVWDLEGHDTHVLGFVSDERLLELYRNASLVIAPLRFGAGVKGKVVEGMARGVPVATTRVGAQGLSGADEYLFIGDTPEEFAAAVRAATDPEAGRSKALAALDYVQEHYSQAAMVGVFKQVLPSPRFISRAA